MAHYKGAAKEAGRAMNLMKKRQKEQEELEIRKKKIEDELKVGAISNKFAVHYDAVENKLKSDTIGLVTLNEMKAKQEDVVKERERQIVVGTLNSNSAKIQLQNKQKDKIRGPLSFATEDDEDDDDDDEDEGARKADENTLSFNDQKIKTEKRKSSENESSSDVDVVKRLKMVKCPYVDTSFLPDREREKREARLREQLTEEWTEKQKRIKNEDIEITYSYWDGSGHRRQVLMKKGSTIQQFLQKCLEQLRKEFNELKTSSVDRLMYVKEDLIIAHHFSFYDFIVTKARGKSGPLFSFDVHNDVRMVSDATVEKDESHAGKVCLRSWYEKNKHIFPASRWEPYDPEKKWDKYTVSDKESAKIIVK